MINERSIILIFLIFMGGIACKNQDQQGKDSFWRPIQEAHHVKSWQEKGVFKSGIVIILRGDTTLAGTMYADANSHLARFELKNGGIAVFDGQKAWVAPSLEALPNARFDLLTWPYFLKAPYKLNDPGTQMQVLDPLPLQDDSLPAAKLTFEEGVGDTPDDWYIVYRNPDNQRLAGMAYIITYGKSRQKAEEEPHAITYHEFKEIDDVPVSTFWRVWNWSRDQGITEEEPIETIELTDPEFIPMDSSLFQKPEGAMESSPPS